MKVQTAGKSVGPGAAKRHFQEMFASPLWVAFEKLRTRRWQQTPEAKAKKREYAKKWYQERGKALRAKKKVTLQDNETASS